MNVFTMLHNAISGQPDNELANSSTTNPPNVEGTNVNQFLDEKVDHKVVYNRAISMPTALGRFCSSTLFDINLIRVIGEHLGLVCVVSCTSSEHTTIKYLMADRSLSIHIDMEKIITIEKKGSCFYPTKYLFDIQAPLISDYKMSRIPDLHIGIMESIPLKFALKLLAIHNPEHREKLRVMYKN